MAIFVLGFCSSVYFLKTALTFLISPELTADMERLREQRRRRKAARRDR
jgi:hypothetical protein